jgi:hypothetical protein
VPAKAGHRAGGGEAKAGRRAGSGRAREGGGERIRKEGECEWVEGADGKKGKKGKGKMKKKTKKIGAVFGGAGAPPNKP